MTRKPFVRTRAAQDLVEHADFISHDSLTAATSFLDAFDETVKDILVMPGLSTIWETANPKFRGVRFRPIKGFPKHLVFYRQLPDGIEVLRILHASRDLESLL